jgi:hypothetical protein
MNLKLKMLVVLGSALTLGSGCATQARSLALGGSIGAGAGAIAGGLANPGKDGKYRTRNVLIGAGLGGAAGLLSGALIHGAMEDGKKEGYEQGKLAGKGLAPEPGNPPTLKDPQVEAHWIEPHSVGNRYIDGHFEYVIVNPARWDAN